MPFFVLNVFTLKPVVHCGVCAFGTNGSGGEYSLGLSRTLMNVVSVPVVFCVDLLFLAKDGLFYRE